LRMALPVKIPFTKMEGTGNDFIVFDNRDGKFTGDEAGFFSRICQRRFAVGADGVILIEKGKLHPVRMRYFNRDGHEAEMCGNGARCVAYYARKKGIVRKDAFVLEASDGIHSVRIRKNTISLQMIEPGGYRSEVGILRESEYKEGGLINTGVPHYVIIVPDVDPIDIRTVGRYYCHHEAFPEGTNVDLIQFQGENRIRFRIYERGVEDETCSSGTGSVASALIASRLFGCSSPVQVETRGGNLVVAFDSAWKTVFLEGPVSIGYEGMLFPEITGESS
jgi:diaminopimelate epimerase